MPDLLAHHDVAQAARRRLTPGPLSRLLEEAPDAYAVGAQGPDFFSYTRLWAGRGARDHPGRTVHREHTAGTFATMLAEAAAASPRDRAALYAYVCGYATHLCLDGGAHPWIIHWTGHPSPDIDSAEAVRATRRHGVLEASIDVMLASRHRPPGFSWRRSMRLLSLSPRRRRAIGGLWSTVLRDVYGIAYTTRAADAALLVMHLVYGQLTSPTSPLSLITRAGSTWLDGDGIWGSQIYPSVPHPTAVRLFNGRREWHSPWRPDETRRETFAELCDRAVAESVTSLQAIERAVSGETSVAEAVAMIGDRSMVSGEPCDDPRAPTAFAPDQDAMWDGV